MGNAMSIPMATRVENCLVKRNTIRHIPEPNTFRILISLMRFSVVNAVSPKSPKHDIIIAKAAAYFESEAIRCSDEYNA